MNESEQREQRFMPKALHTPEDVIRAIQDFGKKRPEEQRTAANMLGQFLSAVDTSKMSIRDRAWVESNRQNYSDKYRDIGDPKRTLEDFRRIFVEQNE